MWGETKTGEQRDTQNSETCCGVEALLLSRGGRRGCCRHPGKRETAGRGTNKSKGGRSQLRSCPQRGQGLQGETDMASNIHDLTLEVKRPGESQALCGHTERAQNDCLRVAEKHRFKD